MKLWKGIAILAFAMSLSGCAVFKGGNIPETTLTPPEQAKAMKPSLFYSVIANGIFFRSGNLPDTEQNLIAGELAQVLKESNYFSAIMQDGRDADINMSVTMTNTGSPAAMIPAFITGLSLWTIPTWMTEYYEVKTTVKTKNGQTKEYEMSDSAIMVSWLPMILVAPVKNFSEINKVRENMYRNLLMRMKDDGLLVKKIPTGIRN